MLHNIVDVFEHHPQLTPKKLATIRAEFGQIVGTPPEDIPFYSDIKKSMKPGKSYVCLVHVKNDNLFSDDFYQRIKEVDITQCIENISKKGGFNYNDSNTLFGFLRPTNELLLTQGQHRTIMALICSGTNYEDSYVVMNVHVHEKNLSLEKMQEIESDNFNTDCRQRKNMTPSQRFRGGFAAKDPYYTQIYDFVRPFNVSIANTHVDGHDKVVYKSKKTFEKYNCLIEAISYDSTPHKQYVKQALDSLVNNLIEPDINGPAFCGLVLFLREFDSSIQKVEGYSLDDFLHYVFHERPYVQGGKVVSGVTLQQISNPGSAKINRHTYFAARWVNLFNDYAQTKKKRVRVNSKLAISDGCKEWIKFTSNLDTIAKGLYKPTDMLF